MRPILGKLDLSQVESLASRLNLLDFRVSSLTAHALKGRQNQQMDEECSGLDSVEVYLNEVK